MMMRSITVVVVGVGSLTSCWAWLIPSAVAFSVLNNNVIPIHTKKRRKPYHYCHDDGTLLLATLAEQEQEREEVADPISTTQEVEAVVVQEVDNRPHEQRAKAPRAARRLNHAFRYLYRHDHNSNNNNGSNQQQMSAEEFLQQQGGYSKQQIQNLHEMFPPLLELDVQRHLKPKMRFLKETILGMTSSNNNNQVLPEDIRSSLPPHYYGARLERIVAPRHAFLVHFGLPHGRDLLEIEDHDRREDGSTRNTSTTTRRSISTTRWQDFLKSCRNPKSFANLCNRWAVEQQQRKQPTGSHSKQPPTEQQQQFTRKQIEAFDVMFGRGLMAASRDYLCQTNNTWPLEYINITSGEMIHLLIQHGANPMERDNRGVSLLHWAAGTGNLDGVKALLPYFSAANTTTTSSSATATEPTSTSSSNGNGVWIQNERDGATPLHWSAAGANPREFGVGGHPEVCQYILSQLPPSHRREYFCQLTKDGNSALMWAAWSGTLETVKFLIRNRADPLVANRNGCTVAHWASSGGNLEVCQYLANTVGVDFLEPNYGGNTPLTHAVAFGRAEVVEWLRKEVVIEEDGVAADLAWDFVDWTDGQDAKRQEVLKLFEDWYSHDRIQ